MSSFSSALIFIALIICVHHASASSVTDIDELDLQQQQQQRPRQQLANNPGLVRSPVANDVIAIKEGADLDLSCPIVVKNEDMIISWTCDNEPANIRSSRIHVTDNGKLRIRSSKVGDSCNYRCEVADGHGALSVIIKVIIVDQRLMDELTRRSNLPGAGRFPPSSSSLQTVNDDARTASGETASPPKKRIIGKQQRENRPHTPAPLVAGMPSKQELGAEIEMQIEPSEIAVERNKTFSLECRIKHAPHQATGSPTIIWLKEYMGGPVESIKEALDKNLIYLDGVYYHSLNWPRAITYANKSSSASSALLIRQSSFMHSGRYVCFAGYPASVMKLDQSNSMLSAQAAGATNGGGDPTSSIASSPANNPSPLRYKIAAARVLVDDKEGEASYRESLEWTSTSSRRSPTTAASHVLMSVVSTNTWQRNLTILLLAFCGSLMLVKLVMVMRDRARKNQPLQHVAMINDDVEGESPRPPPKSASHNIPQPTIESAGGGEPTGSDSLLLDAGAANLTHYTLPRDRFSDVPANSLIAGNNPLRDEYRIDQELLNERLSGIDTSSNNNNGEHVYTEIGANNNNNNNNTDNNQTVPKAIVPAEPYYKLPNKN